MTVEAPPIYPYLTWVPERTPRNKAHENIGLAKKAVLYRLRNERLTQDCRIYKWENSQWELLWDIKQGTQREELPWR